ncbi:AMP-binding protein [Pusillimonas sp. CC-YST705]|uniref:AMP-binding protein n=2 Tax=Mesopusillimonas faecipullorum TaxID=2755040 RepID=A0ABS8C9K4_9BURK|nr:AMP-binding protein [Mesopusillimonas faecipullorum]
MTDQYAALYASYQWLVPSQMNIAQACIHRWAENSHEGRRIALHVEDEFGQGVSWSYQQLSDMAHQLANGLLRMGVQPGDRVVVAMAQPAQFLAALSAVLDVGAVAVPLSTRMSAARRIRCVRDAKARTALVDASSGPELLQSQAQCPELIQVVGLGFTHDDIIPWRTLLARQPTTFKPRLTRADAPALLLFDIADKHVGQLFSHQALIGALPGFVCAQSWFPQAGDSLYTSLDWCSTEGLLGGVLPALYFGRPCITSLAPNLGQHCYEILERYRVSNLLVDIQTLLRLQATLQAQDTRPRLALRAIALQAPPTANTSLLEWCQRELGVQPDVLFSLPQAVAVIGQAHEKWPSQAGSIGRPYPGHLATVLDSQGHPSPAGAPGELVLNRYDIQGHSDPARHLGTWKPDGTWVEPEGDWLHTGLGAYIDKQGDIWLVDALPVSGG